jgi:hypothetical protein
MKPITAGFILLAAGTKPDVLSAGTINIPRVSVPIVAHLTTPQANTKNVTPTTYRPYLRFQLGTAAVGKVQWGSTGGAPAGGGGGAGKVHKLNPNWHSHSG